MVRNDLGQEVIGGRSYGSDLSTAWLNMLEGGGGKTKVYQWNVFFFQGTASDTDSKATRDGRFLI